MPGASVRSRGNRLTVAPLPPLLPPSGARHQPEIPYNTGIRGARPTGFEPVTFGSVADSQRNRYGSRKPNLERRLAKTRQKLDHPPGHARFSARERARVRRRHCRPRVVRSRRPRLRNGDARSSCAGRFRVNRDEPADRPPLRPEQVGCAAQRVAHVHIGRRDGAAVLVQERQVRAERRQHAAAEPHNNRRRKIRHFPQRILPRSCNGGSGRRPTREPCASTRAGHSLLPATQDRQSAAAPARAVAVRNDSAIERTPRRRGGNRRFPRGCGNRRARRPRRCVSCEAAPCDRRRVRHP
jgi:hypothetical protein